jgi:hypothetical protein
MSLEQVGLTRRRLLALAAGAAATLAVDPAAAFARPAKQRSIVWRWNSVLITAIENQNLGAPIMARAIAIVNTSMFDAWAAYDRVAVGTRLGGSLRRPHSERTEANKRKAISYAAYLALSDLFGDQRADIKGTMRRFGYDPSDPGANPASPSGVGTAAARAVLSFRHGDGANQLGSPPYSDTTGFQSPNTWNHLADPNLWQPLRLPNGSGGFVVQQYLGPHWGQVAPFALASGDAVRHVLPPPYRLGQPEFVTQAQQVFDDTARLNDRTKAITEFWADPPGSAQPPGHWLSFAQYVAARDRHDLDTDAKFFLIVGNALLDASIACWDLKRFYDSVRPVTAIRLLFAGRKERSWSGSRFALLPARLWAPFQPPQFLTPPFPEYPSGHSTFSAASAEVMRAFTGSDRFGFSTVIGQGTSIVEPGSPRHAIKLSFPTFSAAAAQAGMSRRYGGYHFALGDVQGRRLGRLVGARVLARARSLSDGSA